ncbi:MAG: hypothetical protein ACREH8_18125, partial [Opitutaceae bacterium]
MGLKATVQQVAWQGSGKLLLTTRDGDPKAGDPAATFRLMTIEPRTRREDILFSATTTMGNPLWVAGGAGCLWQQRD